MLEELNKKLAEWAGFRFNRHISEDKVMTECWVYPDNNWNLSLPNFTQSLDACFKWLVPKLSYWDIGESGRGQCAGWARTTTSKECFMAGAPTPALALCLAIEKLIDSEVLSAPSG